MSLVAELRRRHVFRAAAAYLVVGWLLTEVLTTILPTLGAPAWAARTVILVFAFGFFPAVIFSWFYEITPEGIKRDHEVDRDNPENAQRRSRIDNGVVAAIIVLIFLVGLFSAQRISDDVGQPDSAASIASVAVLPFVNMSSDSDNEYFSDGLTETLLHMLAQIPDLKVAARTSSFAFKGKNLSIAEIAAALQVAHVLEGSVQRAGDRVRITAQLIRASDGFHIWSENYDRELDDIFAIQDEIAEKVGYALSESLLGERGKQGVAKLATTDPDAYDLYMQARKERATYSYGGLTAAEDLLKGALLIDPDFVDAKTELAMSYFHQVETGLMKDRDAYPEVVAITEQVLESRPDDANARAALMFAKAFLRATDGDASVLATLVTDLEALVDAAPSELQPRILLVRAYRALQRDDAAATVLEDALQQDPYNPSLHYELGTSYIKLRRWSEARLALQKSLEIEPAQPNAHTNLGILSLQAGDGVAFVKQFFEAIAVDPRDHELPGVLAGFLYELGLIDEGDDLRSRVLALAPTSEIAYRLELLRAINTGDHAAGDASARRAVDDDIDNRRFGYSGAVQYLMRKAADEETVDALTSWLEERAPRILDVDATIVPQKYRATQGVAFDAWYVTLPRTEMLRRLNTLLEFGATIGYDLTNDPRTHLNVLALRGDVETAIEVALREVFSQSVAMNLDWQRDLAQAQYEDVTADSRVQAAMRRWLEEEAKLRESVRTYFAELSAAR
ncbi:MAG: tetratricopeptide repeat protein [Woeseiaceae bacterium]